MSSFIVELWARVFEFLGKASVFSLVLRLFPRARTAGFVDAWVLGHLLFSFLALLLASWLPHDSVAASCLIIYGFVRVIEIAVYQTNVLLFDEYRCVKHGGTYALHGYRRIILLLIHNYFEIILWLGCTYTVLADHYLHKWEGGARTMLGAVYSSFITMTTFGEFDLMPQTDLAAGVLLFHATVGLFMTLLSLARFISLIPEPATRDTIENKAREQK